MTAPDRLRDGGPFTAGTVCPWCGVGDVHHLRSPNREEPELLDVIEARDAAGRVVLRDEQFDRWDERPFTIVRTCTSCSYSWGQR